MMLYIIICLHGFNKINYCTYYYIIGMDFLIQIRVHCNIIVLYVEFCVSKNEQSYSYFNQIACIFFLFIIYICKL